MHRSRLSTFVIDCTGGVEQAAAFWSAALGRPVLPDSTDDPTYRQLEGEASEPILLVQAVDHPGRIHLDIETDDLEAEVARLEALGAKRIRFYKRWWLMEAPTGQVFCLVNPQRGPLSADNANEWK